MSTLARGHAAVASQVVALRPPDVICQHRTRPPRESPQLGPPYQRTRSSNPGSKRGPIGSEKIYGCRRTVIGPEPNHVLPGPVISSPFTCSSPMTPPPWLLKRNVSPLTVPSIGPL